MQAINAVLNVFSGDKNILSCCLFGSFARGAATKESDMDLLFAVKAHDEIIEAFKAKDAQKAEALVIENVLEGKRALINKVESKQDS